MKLGLVLSGVEVTRCAAPADCEVGGISIDSRETRCGELFVATVGQVDAHRFLADAVQRGAAVVVGTDGDALQRFPAHVVVKDARVALARMAANFYRLHELKLRVVGITGTNGKTSITYLLEAGLAAAGMRVGVLGTVSYRFGGREFVPPHTTPEAPVLSRFLREMDDAGVAVAAAEISSHAISLRRVEHLDLAIAIFTNLSQDHLDFHGSMAEYGRVKERLFTELLPRSPRCQAAVVNVDDELGRRIAAEVSYPVLRYALKDEQADVRARGIEAGLDGTRFVACGPWGEVALETRLVGLHNVYNVLAALCAVHLLGCDVRQAAEGIGRLGMIPGRLQAVPNPLGLGVFVDYAHSPDSLEKVLAALRPAVKGRLITLFGAGGDRDAGKRPLMGRVVERLSDLAVVTSDNPRTEPPLAIIDQVLSGMSEPYRLRSTLVVPDRRTAIDAALSLAWEQDAVLLAGKGHEDYQIIGTVKQHFDDREVARDVIARLARRQG
jgi:UDP-N-acetylmuramyl-tripeptide synthetase